MSIRKKPVQEARRPSSSAASRIYSRENVSRYTERSRQRRRGRAIRRGILLGFFGVFIAAVAAAGMWFSTVLSRLNDGEIITADLLNILVDTDVTREPFYMLLLGTDGRPGEETYRTDSIILARVDPTQKQVTLISVPRDTKFTYKGSTVKINSVFSYGGSDDMVEAVNELCGVEISEYAEINFDGMKALVDAVERVVADAPSAADSILGLVRALAEALRPGGPLMLAMLGSGTSATGASAVEGPRLARVLAILTAQLERAKGEGLVREDADSRLCAAAVAGAFLVFEHVAPDGAPESVEALTQRILDLALFGVGTERGRAVFLG